MNAKGVECGSVIIETENRERKKQHRNQNIITIHQ